MSRLLSFLLFSLFLNTGAGNEFSPSRLQTLPAGSPASRGEWVARHVQDRETGRDARMALRMKLHDRQQRVRERALTSLSMKGGPGRPTPGDRSLIRFTFPHDISGTGFLVWEHPAGEDERFLFLPSLGRVRRIGGNEAQDSFVGSDFTYEDIGGREFDDYTYALTGDAPERAEWVAPDGTRHPAYRLESRSKDRGSRFPRVISLVRQDNFVVVGAEIRNRRDEVQKVFEVRRLEKIASYWTVMEMTMRDVLQGTRTELVVERAEYNIGLTESAFTRRELERIR